MHEQGYQFIGDTSYYRLTIPEMRTLAGGFAVMQQTKKDAQQGVTDEHREGLAEYNEKLTSKNGRGGSTAPDDRMHHGQQQHPAGAPPGASARPRTSNRNNRRGR